MDTRTDSDLVQEAFRWTVDTGMVGLGTLPGTNNSAAADISADGTIVVGRCLGPGSQSVDGAFIWSEEEGMDSIQELLQDRGLPLFGWSLQYAEGVSADGSTVVGYGTNPMGEWEGWIATIGDPIVIPSPVIPSPHAFASGLVLIGVCWRGGRQRAQPWRERTDATRAASA